LKKDFASYFRRSGLSTVVLHGPRDEVQCNLIIRPTFFKIGAGWKIFSAHHKISAEDHREVVFEVESEKTSIHVKVIYPLNFF